MKKLIFLIPLLLLMHPAFGEMIVENDQTYIGNDGIMHIVGEIRNESKSPVNKIKIIATLTDENGKVVDKIDGKRIVNISGFIDRIERKEAQRSEELQLAEKNKRDEHSQLQAIINTLREKLEVKDGDKN